MARTPAEQRAFLARLESERAAQFVPADPRRPVYRAAECLPGHGNPVKVWDASDRGTSARWSGLAWTDFRDPIGPVVRWQEMPPPPDTQGADAPSLRTAAPIPCNDE